MHGRSALTGDIDNLLPAGRTDRLPPTTPFLTYPALLRFCTPISQIERILPTLATRDDLHAAIAPLATKAEL